jgi:hypothetical protein
MGIALDVSVVWMDFLDDYLSAIPSWQFPAGSSQPAKCFEVYPLHFQVLDTVPGGNATLFFTDSPRGRYVLQSIYAMPSYVAQS